MPSEPVLLAFDTSAAHCAAALVSGGRLLATRGEPMARGQAERLLPMLEEALAQAGLGWDAVGAVAVCTGPGNFTGIRIGVAAARGLALGLGVPAIGLTRFDVLGWLGAPDGIHRVRVGTMLYCQNLSAGRPDGPASASHPDDGDVETLLDPADLARAATLRLARAPVPARPAPFYVREPDATPAREVPPLLLP